MTKRISKELSGDLSEIAGAVIGCEYWLKQVMQDLIAFGYKHPELQAELGFTVWTVENIAQQMDELTPLFVKLFGSSYPAFAAEIRAAVQEHHAQQMANEATATMTEH